MGLDFVGDDEYGCEEDTGDRIIVASEVAMGSCLENLGVEV